MTKCVKIGKTTTQKKSTNKEFSSELKAAKVGNHQIKQKVGFGNYLVCLQTPGMNERFSSGSERRGY